jgi:hypothetical protein
MFYKLVLFVFSVKATKRDLAKKKRDLAGV